MQNFQLEKIDQKTARKNDTMKSVSIVDIEALKKQKTELEQEVSRLNKMLDEINQIIVEFEKLP